MNQEKNKCVKGCRDLRDIHFIRMGLQFASESFFSDGTHTHTNTDTQTHIHTHLVIAQGNNPTCGVTYLTSDIRNSSSDVRILSTGNTFSTKVTNFAFFVTNLSTHKSLI